MVRYAATRPPHPSTVPATVSIDAFRRSPLGAAQNGRAHTAG